MSIDNENRPRDFIRDVVAQDCESNKWDSPIVTRFPPEPNGYLHIGHAKAFGINFGIAQEFGGRCHLRFDDTNPTTEDVEYVDAIEEDIRWMGWDWGEHRYFASDYFQQMYDHAETLIQAGKAYVDDQSPDEMRAGRGTLTSPGVNSPYRDRSVEENLDLFRRMKAGEFPDGSRVLRAKIDMASPNLNMRDPAMYRILHATHHRTGDEWCIYPMYDWAHGLEDSIEGVTHSLCSLEFENHRPLYNWFLDQLPVHHPQQMEFARFNLTRTVMSKRILLKLVEGGHVTGWDDPRLPTLRGLRRRGFTPAALRDFLGRIGVAKFVGTVEIALLEHCQRADLNKTAPRAMGVLRPLKVVIDNYPEGQIEQLEAVNNPEAPDAGTREVPFGREIYIEQEDFMEDPPRKFFRLAPGREVRLRYAYFITCTDVVKDASGEIVEIHCTYDPATRGGDSPDGRKVKSTLHWVAAETAIKAEVRLYDHLFTKDNPLDVGEDEDFTTNICPDSLEVLHGCPVEPSLAEAEPYSHLQLERLGYFCVDPDSAGEGEDGGRKLVLNRTLTLRDTWAKIQNKQDQNKPPNKTKTNKKEKKDEKKKMEEPKTTDENTSNVIQYEDFAKIDLRVAKIMTAEAHPNADRLLVLTVDLGSEQRQIIAGIRDHYEPEALVGKQVIVVANLAPRKMRGVESQGMLLAAADESGESRDVVVLCPDKEVPAGSSVS